MTQGAENMTQKSRNLSGRLIGGVLLAAGVAAVFFFKVQPAEEPADATIRPIKSVVVGAEAPLPKLYFPGTVEPDAEVDLSFEVGGRLVEFPVKCGQEVQAGDVLGRLDPSNFENQVKNAEADLEKARSSLERIERALQVHAVSQDEASQARAAVQKAEAQLAIQRKALADTVLKAAFGGRVSETYADNYDAISPGKPVLKLQDIATLAIAVAVPEKYLQLATPERRAASRFAVEFETVPGQSYPAAVKEYATVADPATQTYRVTFSFANPGAVVLLPGMTGTVVVDVARPADEPPALVVPSNAVGFGSDGAAFAWVLDDQGGGIFAARRQTIQLGERTGEQIAVLSGLAAGTRIAAAGVAILTEGRQVRLLDEPADAAEAVP